MAKTAAELRVDIEDQRAALSEDLEAIGDRLSPHRAVERRKAAMGDRWRRVKGTVMGAGDEVQDRAHGLAGDVQDRAHGLADRAHGNPLAAGLVAFGLGLVAAAAFPPSERERRVVRQVQPQLEEASRRLGEAGRDVAEELQPAVREAGSHLQEAAGEAAGRVGSSAKEAAGSVADQARQAAQDVAGTGREGG